MEKLIVIVMCSWFVLGAISTHFMVGRKREPITPGIAIFSYIIAMLLMIGTIYLQKGSVF